MEQNSFLAIPRLFLPYVIREIVVPGKPGVYALGNDIEGFKVGYVGRSDLCLQARLLHHNYLYEFEYFIFQYADDEKEAFYLECQYWHASRELEIRNINHPASPPQSQLCCPYCHFAKYVSRMLAE